MHNPCAVIPVYNHETAVPAVVDALLAAGGNLTQASQELGMAKTTLFDKVKKYGLTHNGPDTQSGPGRWRGDHSGNAGQDLCRYIAGPSGHALNGTRLSASRRVKSTAYWIEIGLIRV